MIAARFIKRMLVAFGLLIAVIALLLGGFRIAAALRETGSPMPAEIQLVPTSLGRVAAAVTGPADGPAILLVHGTAGWSGFWRHVSARLAQDGWRVIAVDLPPFGYSDHDPAARYDRTAQARRLSELLARLAPRGAVVVGHSFGAGAATELALRSPGQLRSLVLVDPALGQIDPEAGQGATATVAGTRPFAEAATSVTVTNPLATQILLRSMLARKDSAAAWVPTIRQPMRRPGTTGAYARWLPALVARDDGALSRRSAALRRISVPVALIWGEADTVTPIAQGEALARLMTLRAFHRLPGVGHIPHIEDERAFLAALARATAPDRAGGRER